MNVLYVNEITFQKLLTSAVSAIKFGRDMSEVYYKGATLLTNNTVPENEIYNKHDITTLRMYNQCTTMTGIRLTAQFEALKFDSDTHKIKVKTFKDSAVYKAFKNPYLGLSVTENS